MVCSTVPDASKLDVFAYHWKTGVRAGDCDNVTARFGVLRTEGESDRKHTSDMVQSHKAKRERSWGQESRDRTEKMQTVPSDQVAGKY